MLPDRDAAMPDLFAQEPAVAENAREVGTAGELDRREPDHLRGMRSGDDAQRSGERAQGSLKWERGSDYHLVSECGRFKVSKVFTNGRASYGAWRVDRQAQLGRQRWLALGMRNADEAKAVCEMEALR